MNLFGGDWTDQKMKIVVDYARAYLKIMANQDFYTIYFDGFAGSGFIIDEDDASKKTGTGIIPFEGFVDGEMGSEIGDKEKMKIGTALQILDINEPKAFDLYYFVELNEKYKHALELQISERYPGRNARVVRHDCNNKLVDLSNYLKENRKRRALVFVDPYGMEVHWASIEALKGLGVDLWILVPTGVGANRLLKVDGKISDKWYSALEIFLGLPRIEIDKRFYHTQTIPTLFGDQTSTAKVVEAVEKLGILYSERLKEIFKYVSNPFVMKNSKDSTMYHFMMATNNKNGHKIANDVIKPKFG
jgi:three-Cys-motif partner protein